MRKKRARTYRKASEWVKVAETLAENNGGLLPNVQWLITNDYWALYQQMRRDKKSGGKLYDHIQQEKKVRTKYKAEYWVKEAEKIAKKYQGVLPSPSWMYANGFGTLYSYIINNSELFSHIPQRRGKQTI